MLLMELGILDIPPSTCSIQFVCFFFHFVVVYFFAFLIPNKFLSARFLLRLARELKRKTNSVFPSALCLTNLYYASLSACECVYIFRFGYLYVKQLALDATVKEMIADVVVIIITTTVRARPFPMARKMYYVVKQRQY